MAGGVSETDIIMRQITDSAKAQKVNEQLAELNAYINIHFLNDRANSIAKTKLQEAAMWIAQMTER